MRTRKWYDEQLIKLVGVLGLNALRDRKLITTCGSIDGRTLYTVDA